MFTGIIKEKGEVKSITFSSNSGILGVYLPECSVKSYIGQSIAVNGICLTVRSINAKTVYFDFSPETFKKSSLKYMKTGTKVNIEPALSVNSDISGHFVLGHIDGTGKVINKRQYKNAYIIGIANNAPESSKYLIDKGSIAVDGISLTINEIKNNDFYVSIIPLTYKFTNLGDIKIGEFVNIEFDIIEKAVINNSERLLKNSGSAASTGSNNLDNNAEHSTYNKNSHITMKHRAEQTDITREFLYENGFLK
ncbi:MAG: riboflavin synthase [Candidatus Acididesulfobacter guangdongensis]|uniref:Riboflavin synthase n=1 Tax=Acididesulfobacter guangdongensis TaxID=2597225 RepID=A0A519BIX9_ACIG2|nr:MAG: riboflavin synthase [Candidatus Acididesulfobacter guangdongensis]